MSQVRHSLTLKCDEWNLYQLEPGALGAGFTLGEPISIFLDALGKAAPARRESERF